jgi:hypothetical protein
LSYEIFYNKQFVQLRKTGEVIPMLLAGSNNCYEIGLGGRNGRRSRSWESDRFYNRKGKISEKPEVILDKLDAELRKMIREHRNRGDSEATPKDIKQHFGYYASLVVGSGHCAGTSWDKYRGVYANGIKSAMTVEQLDKLGVNLVFHAGYMSENGYPASVPLKTEREYFAELKKWREWQANGGRHFYLTFSPSDDARVVELIRRSKRKAPRERQEVEQDHYFVLRNSNGNLLRYTSRGYRYSYSQTGGKHFRTKQEAEKRRKQLVDEKRHQADTWKVVKVEGKAFFRV